jgi:hypothetical protein
MSDEIAAVPEDDLLVSSEEELDDYFDYDGDAAIVEYRSSSGGDDDDDDPDEITTKKRRYIFPKPIHYNLFESTDDIDKMFNNHVQVYTIPQRWNARHPTVPSRVVNVKLCRLYLLKKPCVYNNLCKFAHHFTNITRCKYDFCKKTKLIGPGVFVNESHNMCRLRHHTESLNSFIYRTKQTTVFDLRLTIFSEFVDEFRKHFVFPMKCKSLHVTIVSRDVEAAAAATTG